MTSHRRRTVALRLPKVESLLNDVLRTHLRETHLVRLGEIPERRQILEQSLPALERNLRTKEGFKRMNPHNRQLTPWLVRMVTLFGALGLLSWSIAAQTIYGNLSGRVTDQTGAAIAGARVEARNMDTGETRETTTGSDGVYLFRALPGGRYSVKISADTFETLVREPIAVTVARDATVDVELKPGSTQEVVTIEGDAALIETTRSQISKQVDARRILELPGRNSLNGLALLQAGVVNNQNGRPGSGFAVNGARTRSNNFLIDGTQNNDPSLSIPTQNLPPEALAEFQIITNNFSAEYGRNGGAIVQQITRSGTNEFSGIAHYTWFGNGLNALTTAQQRTFAAARAAGFSERESLRRARSVTVNNTWGGTFGGPIKKDKIFFFTSFDRTTERTTVSGTNTLALAPAAVTALQNYANTVTSGPDAFAPGALQFLLNTFPVANDPTPRGTLTIRRPSDNAIILTLPVQQFNRALQGAPLPFGTTFWRILARGDIQLTNNDRFTLRYLQDRSRDPGAPAAIPGNEIGTNIDNYNGAVNYIRTFSPRAVNEFRFSYVDRALNFPENLPPAFVISGFNSVGNANFPQFRNSKVIEFTDNFTFTVGRHTLKFGGSYNRVHLDSFFAPNFRGTVQYPSMQEFLFDRNALFSQYAGTGLVPARVNELGVFVQDDFRITPELTLNLGLRYEYVSAPFGYFSNAEADINNFAPRVGFAWNPRVSGDGFIATMLGGDKTVIRGGYGISYDQIFLNILLNTSRNFPRGVNIALGNITGQRLYIPANRPAPPTPQQFTGDPNLLPVRLYSPNKRVALPYQQSFNLGFERQLFSDYVLKVFYIGSRGLKLVREVESNIGFFQAAINNNPAFYANILPTLRPVTIGGQPAFRRDPSRGSILVGDGLASSWYHSLQITHAKRFRHGIQYELNYTWSAFINDSDDILGGQVNATLPANPLNFRQDRARSGLDQPHRLVANYTFEMPRITINNWFFDRLLNGWSMSGISTFASGTPFSVLSAVNALGILPGQISTVELSQRVSINPNGVPGTATGFPGVTNPFYVLNPANSGINGNAGRNILRTGGIASTDLAFVKNIRTFGSGDRQQTLQIRWEVFNVFNRRNFTVIPANTVSANTNPALFLNLGQTNVGGRSMIFTARYIF